MKRKDGGAMDDVQEFSGAPVSAPTITPADIQQKEFHVSRFGGYRMRDVDEYLDLITEAMTKILDENQRLRSGAGAALIPSVGAPDLAETSRQADEIIARARAEAAAILQAAREQAVSGAGAPGPETGRGAVTPFLNQEREFLQELAALVQRHAESVKGMAKASRAAGDTRTPAAPVAASTPETSETRTASEAPAVQSSDDVAEPEAEPVAGEGPDAEPPQVAGPSSAGPAASQAPAAAPPAAPTPTEPIRVEEPATASVGAGDADDDVPAGEGDRSLRELFWGEE